MAKGKKYRNNGGIHITENGEKIGKDKIFVSNVDVIAKFGDKFSIVGDEDNKPINELVETKELPGKDITDEFELTEALEGIKIMSGKGGSIKIYDTDGSLLNEDTKLKKKDVEGFLAEYE